jgi:hypothetical protein
VLHKNSIDIDTDIDIDIDIDIGLNSRLGDSLMTDD